MTALSIILRTVPGTCLIAGSRDYFLESLTLKCEMSAFPNYNIYCQLSIWRVTNWIIMILSKYFKFHKAGDMFISIILKISQFVIIISAIMVYLYSITSTFPYRMIWISKNDFVGVMLSMFAPGICTYRVFYLCQY